MLRLPLLPSILRAWIWLPVCALVALAIPVANAQKATPADALAFEQGGEWERAAHTWREVVQTNPHDATAWASLALDLAREEKYAEAVPAYRKALALNPRLPGLQLNLGLAEFKQGHFEAALAPLRAASTADPGTEQARTLLGMSYYGARRFSEAIKILRPLSSADPGNMELRQVLAQSCLKARDYSCATTEFHHIVEQNPNSAAAHLLMAEALDGLKEHDQALAELQAAAKISAHEPNLHFEIGYVYWEQHHYDDAQAEFEIELANDPANAEALAYLGDIALQRNDLDKAASWLEKATQQAGDLRFAFLELATVRMQQQQYPDAVKALRRAIGLDPKQSDAYYRLGRAYQAMGRTAEAEREFAKFRELHQKSDESARKTLAP